MLTVLTTSRCTAACRHCNMNSGPDRSDTLSYEQIESILDQALDELDLLVVVFAGGEPLLLGAETLAKAIKLVADRGVFTRVVTNGYWATSKETAYNTLKTLKDAGLFEINISADDFHLPWISLQRLRYAYDACIDLGFVAPVIANCHGPSTWLTPKALTESLSRGQDGLALRRRRPLVARRRHQRGRQVRHHVQLPHPTHWPRHREALSRRGLPEARRRDGAGRRLSVGRALGGHLRQGTPRGVLRFRGRGQPPSSITAT